MKRILITAVLFLATSTVHSQQMFQDASGNTQIPVGKQTSSYMFYNTSDKSATIGFSRSNNDKGGYDYPEWKMDRLYGIDLKIKTSEGIGNFFSKNALNPGFTLSGNIGLFKDDWLGKKHYLNLSLRPQIGYNQYAYIHTISPDYSIDKVKKVEASALLNLSTQLNFESRVDSTKLNVIFFFIQTGFKQVNNSEDLDDGEINTINTQSGTKTISTTETGKLGNYEASNVIPLNIDFAYTPRLFGENYIGFNTYFRTNFFKKINTSNAGLGIYLANPKKPSQINGGIGWQFNDLANKLQKDGGLIARSNAFFYVGFAIGAN